MNNDGTAAVYVTTYRRGCTIPAFLRRPGYGLSPAAAIAAGPKGEWVSRRPKRVIVRNRSTNRRDELIACRMCAGSLGNPEVVRLLNAWQWADAILEAAKAPAGVDWCPECSYSPEYGHDPACDRDEAYMDDLARA